MIVIIMNNYGVSCMFVYVCDVDTQHPFFLLVTLPHQLTINELFCSLQGDGLLYNDLLVNQKMKA